MHLHVRSATGAWMQRCPKLQGVRHGLPAAALVRLGPHPPSNQPDVVQSPGVWCVWAVMDRSTMNGTQKSICGAVQRMLWAGSLLPFCLPCSLEHTCTFLCVHYRAGDTHLPTQQQSHPQHCHPDSICVLYLCLVGVPAAFLRFPHRQSVDTSVAVNT